MRLPLLAVLLVPLAALAGCASDAAEADVPPPEAPVELAFLPPVDLECPSGAHAAVLDAAFGSCERFGEPVLEVAGDGAIWYSATCCIGRSPAIWVSRDGGVSFEPLPFADGTGVVRDAFGIEGDFAIDDAGNVYFFDIGAGFPYFTQFRADGTHVHTSTFPFKPLVDRPWVRAGEADEAYILYNTALSSVFLRSEDGGRTWNTPGTEFPCGLMSLGQSAAHRDTLAASGCAGDPRVWLSQDGGRTWGAPIDLPMPKDGPRGVDAFMQPAIDENGTVYVGFTHAVGPEGNDTNAVFLSRVAADGTTAGPFQVGHAGVHDKPWVTATRAGAVALAWYGTDATDAEDGEAKWYLHAAVTFDGDAAKPVFHGAHAQAEPVHVGPLGRSLGDFLQLRPTPDGSLAVAYGDDTSGSLQVRFLRSMPLPGFAPTTFLNGPRPT